MKKHLAFNRDIYYKYLKNKNVEPQNVFSEQKESKRDFAYYKFNELMNYLSKNPDSLNYDNKNLFINNDCISNFKSIYPLVYNNCKYNNSPEIITLYELTNGNLFPGPMSSNYVFPIPDENLLFNSALFMAGLHISAYDGHKIDIKIDLDKINYKTQNNNNKKKPYFSKMLNNYKTKCYETYFHSIKTEMKDLKYKTQTYSVDILNGSFFHLLWEEYNKNEEDCLKLILLKKLPQKKFLNRDDGNGYYYKIKGIFKKLMNTDETKFNSKKTYHSKFYDLYLTDMITNFTFSKEVYNYIENNHINTNSQELIIKAAKKISKIKSPIIRIDLFKKITDKIHYSYDEEPIDLIGTLIEIIYDKSNDYTELSKYDILSNIYINLLYIVLSKYISKGKDSDLSKDNNQIYNKYKEVFIDEISGVDETIYKELFNNLHNPHLLNIIRESIDFIFNYSQNNILIFLRYINNLYSDNINDRIKCYSELVLKDLTKQIKDSKKYNETFIDAINEISLPFIIFINKLIDKTIDGIPIFTSQNNRYLTIDSQVALNKFCKECDHNYIDFINNTINQYSLICHIVLNKSLGANYKAFVFDICNNDLGEAFFKPYINDLENYEYINHNLFNKILSEFVYSFREYTNNSFKDNF